MMIQVLGFPRSGTTWVARMLAHCTEPICMEPLKLNELYLDGKYCWPGVRHLDIPDDPAQFSARLTRIANRNFGVDLLAGTAARKDVMSAIEDVCRLMPWAVGSKNVLFLREWAEAVGGKLVCVVRSALGVVGSMGDIQAYADVRRWKHPGTSTKTWPELLIENMQREHADLWNSIDAPATLYGDMARAYRIRVDRDAAYLDELGAKVVRFENLATNYNVAWGDLLHWLSLEPTAEFEDAVRGSLAANPKYIRYQPELIDAVDAVFPGGFSQWGI